MAFSDFKNIAQVQTQFGITYHEEIFIPIQEVYPSQHFIEDLEFSSTNIDIFSSEGARSELVIAPILKEVYKNYYQTCSFWVQKAISYDSQMNGTPDYIVATKSALGKTVLATPLVIVVEAKRNDFEQGWGQCLAEIIAAQKINHEPSLPVYGIVTDGDLWQFGRLVETTFTKNIKRYTVDNLADLFGALHFILQTATTSIEHYHLQRSVIQS